MIKVRPGAALCLVVAGAVVILGSYYTSSKSRGQTVPSSSDGCMDLLHTITEVPKSEFRIQAIVATPGSGSTLCDFLVGYLTGWRTSSFPNLEKVKAIFYKSQYPFVDDDLDKKIIQTKVEKVLVLYRDPFDAGFSEFIRHKLQDLEPKESAGQAGAEKRYENINNLKEEHFIDSQKPSKDLEEWMNAYMVNWKGFHKYWLSEHTGPVKLVSYSYISGDESRLTDVTEYLGYDHNKSPERRRRYECFNKHIAELRIHKRPEVKVIEDVKGKMRKWYEQQTKEGVDYVKHLYQQKYMKDLVLS